MHNQDLSLCAEFGANDQAQKNTIHERTDYNPKTQEVRVTLRAKRDSKYKSLDATCNRHFMAWQRLFYTKIGYKRAEIIKSEKSPVSETTFLYTLVYRLKF